MELQIKTAAQMRDQGHALKQKALDLVSEAERKVTSSAETTASAVHYSLHGQDTATTQPCNIV